MQLPEKSYT